MRGYIARDEWWPVYSIEEPLGDAAVDIPDSLVERWKAALAEFAAVQDELRRIANGG